MPISFVILPLRNSRAICKTDRTLGSWSMLCSPHSCLSRRLTFGLENTFLNGKSLRHRSLLVFCGGSNPPQAVCFPWFEIPVEWKQVPWSQLEHYCLYCDPIAHTSAEFEMASDLYKISHPISRWFRSLQPRTPWKYLYYECCMWVVI